MKKLMKALGVLAAVSMLFAGCVEPPAEEEEIVYTLTADKESLPIDVGDSGTITVTTNGTFTAVSGNAAAAIETSGNVITVTGVSAGSATITVTCTEDTTKKLYIPVTVNSVEMTLTLNYSALTAAANVASATVYYGHNQDTAGDTSDDTYETVTAVVNSTAKTASAVLNRSFSKYSSGDDKYWYNNVVITLKDASDNVIEAVWTNATSGEAAAYFTFKADGLTLTAEDPAEKFGTLTITLSGFPEAIGKVTAAVGSSDTITNEAADAAVGTEANTYTIIVSNANCDSGGWFNTDIKVFDTDNTTEFDLSVVNSWLQFSESGMAITVTYVDNSVTWTPLELAGTWTETPTGAVQIVTPATLASLTISQVKIDLANCGTAGTSTWRADVYPDSAALETSKTSLTWSGAISGYSVIIDNADTIALFKANGIYLAGAAGTLTVSYAQ